MRNFGRIVIAGLACCAFTGASMAADLPARTYAKAPVAPVMTYNWTGCYIGGNVGGGWAKTGQVDVNNVNGTAPRANDYGSSEGRAFIGGVQTGCDYQFAERWVVGVQGMFDFGNIDSSHLLPFNTTFYSQNRTKDVFTATARVGYLFAPQVLGYVKGGGAWARIDHNIFGIRVAGNFLAESATGVDRQGWTIGGGLQWMFSPGWSVFGEYNYMDFGRRDIAFVLGPTTGGTADLVRTRLEVQQALVGVNYKFNWSGPVVAKY